MDQQVAIVGAGSWGTTLAVLAARNGYSVRLWCRESSVAVAIDGDRSNPRYVSQLELPSGIEATADMPTAVSSADVIVMAVPSLGFRNVVTGVLDNTKPGVPVVSVTKGLEPGTNLRMTQVVGRLDPFRPVAVLTGPNLVHEIIEGLPAASVVASADRAVGEQIQTMFSSPILRVYTNEDVIGCELAGSLKNVVAIAAGMVDGLGFGANTKATVITRGIAEMTRLGIALGGDPLTFSGLAGLGDLVATCTSKHSRNRSFGEHLASGMDADQISAASAMVAEGTHTANSVLQLAEAESVEMPIALAVASVVNGSISTAEATKQLMARAAREESYGLPSYDSESR